MAIILISYFTYEKIIKIKANVLPDFTTLSNELWFIILIFVFQVTNNMRFSQDGTVKRKDKYLKSRYKFFRKIYGDQIKEITQNEILETIVYAIIIYEDFNRPKIIRRIENLKFRLTKKTYTLGVMQVKSEKLITDIESIKLGTKKIVTAYKKYIDRINEANETFNEWSAINDNINDYNGGTSYYSEIKNLSSTIKETFYEKTADSLNPKV